MGLSESLITEIGDKLNEILSGHIVVVKDNVNSIRDAIVSDGIKINGIEELLVEQKTLLTKLNGFAKYTNTQSKRLVITINEDEERTKGSSILGVYNGRGDGLNKVYNKINKLKNWGRNTERFGKLLSRGSKSGKRLGRTASGFGKMAAKAGSKAVSVATKLTKILSGPVGWVLLGIDMIADFVASGFEGYYEAKKANYELQYELNDIQFNYDQAILEANAQLASAKISMETEIANAIIAAASGTLSEATGIQMNAFVQAIKTQTGAFMEGVTETAYASAEAAIDVGAGYAQLQNNIALREFQKKNTITSARASYASETVAAQNAMQRARMEADLTTIEAFQDYFNTVSENSSVNPLSLSSLSKSAANLYTSLDGNNAKTTSRLNNGYSVSSARRDNTNIGLRNLLNATQFLGVGGAATAETKARFAEEIFKIKQENYNKMFDMSLIEANASINALSQSATASIRNAAMEGLTEEKNARVEAAKEIQKRYLQLAKTAEEVLTKIEENTWDLGKDVGILNAKDLKNFQISQTEIAVDLSRYNVTLEEMSKLNKAYIESTGKNLLFSKSDSLKIAGLKKYGFDDNQINEFISHMYIFNQGVSSAIDMMSDQFKSVGKMGLSYKQLMSDTNKALSLAEKYSFKGGVKGAIEMAKFSNVLKMDMESVGNLIENWRVSLEDTLVKSGKLQVLGGAAAIYSDPLGIMYDAYSAGDDLNERVNMQISDIGSINSNGEYDFTMQDRMRIKAIAEINGLNFEDLLKRRQYALRYGLLGDVIGKNAPEGSNTNFTEEEKMSVMTRAYKGSDGGWYINNREQNPIDITKMTRDDLMMIEADTPEGNIENYAREMVAYGEQIIGSQAFQQMKMLKDEDLIDARLKNGLERMNLMVEDYFVNKDKFHKDVTDGMSLASDNFDSFNKMAKEAKDNLAEERKQIMGYATNIESTLNQVSNIINASRAELKGYLNWAPSVSGIGNIQKTEVKVETETDEARAKRIAEAYIRANGGINSSDVIDRGNMYNKYVFRGNLTSKKFDDILTEGWGDDNELETFIGNYDYGGKTNVNDWNEKQKDIAERVMKYLGKNAIDVNRRLATDFEARQEAISGYQGDGVPYPRVNDAVINDGEIVRTHPQDTGLFAKPGGPIDVLFDKVLAKTSSILTTLDKLVVEPNMEVINNRNNLSVSVNYKSIKQKLKNKKKKAVEELNELNIDLNGNINLTDMMPNMDLTELIMNDPMVLRKVVEMIVENSLTVDNGGKKPLLPEGFYLS